MTDHTVYDNQNDPLGVKRLAQAEEKREWLQLRLGILDGAHAQDIKVKVKKLRAKYTQVSDELDKKYAAINNAFKETVNAIQRDVGASQQNIVQVHQEQQAADTRQPEEPEEGDALSFSERARQSESEEAQWALVELRNPEGARQTNKRKLSIDKNVSGGKKRKLLNSANGEVRSLAVRPDFSVLQRAAGSVAAAPVVMLRPMLRPISRLGGAVKEKFFFVNWKVSALAPLMRPASKGLVQVRYICHPVLIES